jgi:hypothetical protein
MSLGGQTPSFAPTSTKHLHKKGANKILAVWCRALERELADLIAAGQVQARIDSHSKVLYARLTDTRAATFERALKTGARPLLPFGASLPLEHYLHPSMPADAAAPQGC